MADRIVIAVNSSSVSVYAESQNVSADLMDLLSDIRESLNRIYGNRSPFSVKVENVEKFEGEGE